MRGDILLYIRNNSNMDNYLKYHSYWYKELIRNPDVFPRLINEMKVEYKLTVGDKFSELNEKIKLLKSFLEVLK